MKFFGICIVLCILLANAVYAQTSLLPHLIVKGNTKQLLVQGKPFLILGGELGNSSASSIAYMQPVWPKLKAMHLNTLLIPVYWELMEPQEGVFDFTLVDSMIQSSSDHGMKVVLLWFGSWKNSMSCYAPAWVKLNQQRFPRAQDRHGKGLEIMSAFSQSNLDADIKAFAALMKHLKSTDKQQTVVMVQVENEIGMLTEARERGAEANKAFAAEVPRELMRYLIAKKDSLVPELKQHWAASSFATSGKWEAVFGKSPATDELFQAWYYARYADAVAAAGKSEYALPMFVNAALNHRNVAPGQYPSAGPLPHLIDVWQAAAPAIDFLSPDFYNPRFKYYNDLYTRRNNPLFIPEIKLEPSDGAKAFYAIGHYGAIGFSPFSIESADKPETEPVAKSYAILKQLTPQIMQYQGTGKTEGVLLDTATKKEVLTMGGYRITAAHDYTLGWSPEAAKPDWPVSGAIIIQEGENDFVIAGTGVVFTFAVDDAKDFNAGILKADEGTFENGTWVPGRRMNGDQDHQGRHIRIPAGEWGIQRVTLYRYK